MTHERLKFSYNKDRVKVSRRVIYECGTGSHQAQCCQILQILSVINSKFE